jgi:hypothetical protein
MEFLKYLNLPENSLVDSKIDISEIISKLEEEERDSTLVKKYLSSVRLRALINFETTNLISSKTENFEFEEIQIYEVKIRNDNYLSELNELLHQIFPNPALFVYDYKNSNMLSVAKKRINKNDAKKAVTERIYKTELKSMLDIDFLNYLKFFDFDKNNSITLDDYYFNLISKVLLYHYYKLKGDIEIKNTDYEKIENIVDEIYSLNSRKNSLEKIYRQESNLSNKIKINSDINKIDAQIEDLNKELIGG